jgi:hypothetical protein
MILEVSAVSLVFEDVRHDIANKGNKLCAVIYANSRPRVAGYIPLAKAITDHGHLCYLVHPYNSAPSQEEIAGYEHLNIGALPPNKLSRLQGVDVFLSSEAVSDVAPRSAATVGLYHSLHDQGFGWNFSYSISHNPLIVRSLDYYVAAETQKKEHWTVENYEKVVPRIYPPFFLKDRRDHLDIVPGGYPKIEYLERMLKGERESEYISYSPTQTNQPFSEVVQYGAHIIRTILTGFPDFKVVFRPYPSRDIEICREAVRDFLGNPRFVFDDSVTGITYQKSTAVMISDGSSTAITFSLASGRPSVFAKLSDASGRGKGRKMEVFGFRAVGEEEMIGAISHCLNNRSFWHRKIMSERHKYLYNPGRASTYIASKLAVFAERGSDPEWLSIPRSPWVGFNRREEASRHLEYLNRLSSDGKRPLAKKMYEEIYDYVQSTQRGEVNE